MTIVLLQNGCRTEYCPLSSFIFLYLLNLLNLKLLTEIRRKTYKNSDQGLDRDTQERNWKKLEEIRIKTYKS